jgi:hypothetical protein
MMDKDSLNAIDSLEIEPLSDDLLEGVAGASTSGRGCCSCSNCSGTDGKKPSQEISPGMDRA